MSSSKEQQVRGEDRSKRRKLPHCARCRNHGRTVLKKGHSKVCPFSTCPCWKCALISQGTGTLRSLRERSRAGGPAAAPNIWNPAVTHSYAQGGGLGTRTGMDWREMLRRPTPGMMAPLPVVPFPFVDSKGSLSGTSPPLHFYPNMQWRPQIPVGSYPRGPLMFPPLQQGALPYFGPAGHRNPVNWTQVVIGYPHFLQPRPLEGLPRAPQSSQPLAPNTNEDP